MVDYSKWDQLDVSSDEEEERREPRVTRFDQPRQITIGGCAEPHEPKAKTPTTAASQPGNALDVAIATRNGGLGDTYLWSQTGSEVMAHIFIERLAVRGRDVTVAITPDGKPHESPEEPGLPDVAWRACGRRLTISVRTKDPNARPVTVVDGDLQYPVLTDDAYILWELKTYDGLRNDSGSSQKPFPFPRDKPFRTLVLTLTKSVPIAGAVIWWEALFRGGPTIDVAAIPDRRHQKDTASFQEAWNAASRAFRERRQGPDRRTEI